MKNWNYKTRRQFGIIIITITIEFFPQQPIMFSRNTLHADNSAVKLIKSEHVKFITIMNMYSMFVVLQYDRCLSIVFYTVLLMVAEDVAPHYALVQ